MDILLLDDNRSVVLFPPSPLAVLLVVKLTDIFRVSQKHCHDRLVPASHVLDWLFPRETFRIVCPRITRYPSFDTSNVGR